MYRYDIQAQPWPRFTSSSLYLDQKFEQLTLRTKPGLIYLGPAQAQSYEARAQLKPEHLLKSQTQTRPIGKP